MPTTELITINNNDATDAPTGMTTMKQHMCNTYVLHI
jgi:hypothetical protein